MTTITRLLRKEWLVLLLITLLAAALRLYQLGVVPPGPQFDEAFNALDARLVLLGNRPLFLPANGGREVLYTYLQAAVGAVLGLNLYTLRLVSALAGILTVPAVYVLVRRLFLRDSRLLATFTALALTVSYWHIHFSHYGIRVILMPLLLCGVFGLFWLGMHGGSRRARLAAVIAAGALAGLSVWTNPTGRFTPFVAAPYVLWLLWRYPERRKLRLDSPLGGLLLFGLAALVIFLPLGLEFWRHPEFFTGHAAEVSVFAERVAGQGSPWLLLGQNVLRVLGMFSFDGDLEWAHGIANRPVLDWFLAIPFYIGVVIWALRLLGRDLPPEQATDRDSLVLFLLWAIVMLAPSVLSEAAPNYSRTLPAIPAVMLAVGLGLTWIATRPRLQPAWGVAAALALVAAGGLVTGYDYFVRFPEYREVYYVFDADKVDALRWMEEQVDAGNTVYLSPLWSTHATVNFLRSSRIESLDATDALVLPAGGGAVYAFPAEQQDYAETIADRLGAQVETINDKYGRPLLAVVRLGPEQASRWPPDLSPQQATEASFAEAPSLLGLRVRPNGRDLLLYWQAGQTTTRDLTSFVHLIDTRGNRIGQADKIPGDGTYHTQSWSQGDRVIQWYTPEILDACAGGETVRVLAGWYEYAANNARRPRADAAGDSAVAGSISLPFTAIPADAVKERLPQIGGESLALADGLTLVGHAAPATAEQGAPLSLDLALQGSAAYATTPLTLTAAPAQGAPLVLYAGLLAPKASWRDGEVLCRRIHAQLPADLLVGEYALQLAAGDRAPQPIGATLQVTPSTRRYAVPQVALPADAVLGEAVRLHGADVAQQGDVLNVRLVWQALRPLPTDAKVFVHLVDEGGQIVAQSDAEPGSGHRTSQWVEGEVVIDEHALLPLPPTLAGGNYTLRVGMYDPLTGQRLTAVNGANQPYADDAVPFSPVAIKR